MSKLLKSPLPVVVAAVIIYFGFRNVTQAGQQWPLFQSDGYAVMGGLMILAGGILTGLWVGGEKKGK